MIHGRYRIDEALGITAIRLTTSGSTKGVHGVVRTAILPRIDTTGLAAAGIWVRRLRPSPSLADEALSLAHVMKTWQLSDHLSLHHYAALYAELSSPGLPPTWNYLVELVGRRATYDSLIVNHPLSQVDPDEEVRILAIVLPPDFLIPALLVETELRRRILWLRASPLARSSLS